MLQLSITVPMMNFFALFFTAKNWPPVIALLAVVVSGFF
jgi:hypothetical protein